MSTRIDDRGQALQVGAVLLFGILIILFTFWQAFVVPDQNRQVEFNHNQEIQQQMTQVRSTIISMPGETTPRSVTVNLGVQYPTRLLFSNPGPGAGSLETNNTANPTTEVKINNAIVDGSNSPGVASFWDGTTKAYNTGSLEYSPDYSLLQTAPRTVYSNTVLYNEFPLENGSTATVTDQALVDGDTLNLITIGGEYEETRVGRVAVDVNPVSTQSRAVTVQRDGSDPITIELPTRLGEDEWNTLLDTEPARVINDSDDSTVTIQLTREEYTLRMTRVGVGTGASDTQPAYIAGVSGPGIDSQEPVPTDANRTVTVEVRDSYNAPVSGINLSASASNADVAVRPVGNDATNDEGQVTFRIDPTDVNPQTIDSEESVDISFNADNPGQFEDASVGTTLNTAVTLDPSLSQSPSFNVGWDVSSIDNNVDNFDCDVSNNTCNISASQTGELEIDVGANSGTVQFGLTGESAGTLSSLTKEFTGGSATVDFTASNNIPVNGSRETTVFVFGGDDRSALTINVTNELPGLVHYYDAVSDSQNRNPGSIRNIPDLNDDTPAGNISKPSVGLNRMKLIENGINGLPSYDPDAGSGPFGAPFQYDGQEISDPWTVMAVVELTDDIENRPLYDHGTGGIETGSGGLNLETERNQNSPDEHTLATDAGENVTVQTNARGGPVVLVAEGNSSDESLLKIGDTDNSAGTAVANFGKDQTLFFSDTKGNRLGGLVGQILIFDSGFNEDLEDVAQRLRGKWTSTN
jgi:hypothetical protein